MTGLFDIEPMGRLDRQHILQQRVTRVILVDASIGSLVRRGDMEVEKLQIVRCGMKCEESDQGDLKH